MSCQSQHTMAIKIPCPLSCGFVYEADLPFEQAKQMVEIHVNFCSKKLCGQCSQQPGSGGGGENRRTRPDLRKRSRDESDEKVVIIDDSPLDSAETVGWRRNVIKSEDGRSCLSFSKNIVDGDGPKAKYRCRERDCLTKHETGLTLNGYKKHVRTFHNYDINLRKFRIKKITETDSKGNSHEQDEDHEEIEERAEKEESTLITLETTTLETQPERPPNNPSPLSLSGLSWTSDDVRALSALPAVVVSDVGCSPGLNTPVISPVNSVSIPTISSHCAITSP